jgi:tetratricopeptide (TPR) repeat protein
MEEENMTPILQNDNVDDNLIYSDCDSDEEWYCEEQNELDDNKQNYSNDEQIDAITYELDLKIKTLDSLKWIIYFIPEYKIEIIVKLKSTTKLHKLNNDIIEVIKTSKPTYKYQVGQNGKTYETKTTNVKINKKWVDGCLESHNKEIELQKFKHCLFFNAPSTKTSFDIITELFDNGLLCLETGNIKKGLKYFIKCLKLNNKNKTDIEFYKMSCYNISCCHAKLNNIKKALEWLNKSIKYGYTEWGHTIIDNDMKILLNETEFIDIIKTMMIKHPVRHNKTPEIPEKLNSIDLFLKKNNLKHFEKK